MKRIPLFAAMVITLFFAAGYAFAGPQDKTARDASNTTLSGTVAETMDSGAYTYMLLEKDGTKTWVAVPKMKVKKGQHVSLMPGAEMENFTSSTLNRTFEKIIFSAGPAQQPEAQTEMTTSGSKDKVVNPSEKIKVEKASAPNAYTVAEIYGNAERLDKKEVVIRGKVVKVSQAIMGKNWLHVQDGSGEAAKGTHDLVVTTQDQTAVGDVVTVSGTIFKDKDFGSGYKYKVIMENATIKK